MARQLGRVTHRLRVIELRQHQTIRPVEPQQGRLALQVHEGSDVEPVGVSERGQGVHDGSSSCVLLPPRLDLDAQPSARLAAEVQRRRREVGPLRDVVRDVLSIEPPHE